MSTKTFIKPIVLIYTCVLFFQTNPQCLAQSTTNQILTCEEEKLFTLISALEKNIPLDNKVVTRLIGSPLISFPDPYKQNLYHYTKSDYSKLLRQVHLREPVSATQDDNGSLLLEFNPNLEHITPEQIRKLYGTESLVTKQADPEACRQLINYDYQRSWGTLTFQMLDNYLIGINFNGNTTTLPDHDLASKQDTGTQDQKTTTYASMLGYTESNP